MYKEMYEYNGIEYTLGELSRMSRLHRDVIQRRLRLGMSVEEALELPAGQTLPMLSRADLGKQVPIVFTTGIPVLPEMHPIIGKQYIATICGSTNRSKLCHVYYIIMLENGKKLITYPGEFQIQKQA